MSKVNVELTGTTLAILNAIYSSSYKAEEMTLEDFIKKEVVGSYAENAIKTYSKEKLQTLINTTIAEAIE